MTRDPYRDVGEATRRAIERALAARLTPRQWRVFAAALTVTTTYSRLGDRIYVAQLAELARIPGDDETYRHTRRALRELDERGVIDWQGQRGRGRRS
jgi:hypothetical protein